ncbi:hypothetical protein ARMGADRAFT_1028366 [Armillaria gallica]|uniref:Uncharacterized protein n=1 Tax=Armillaria gallica TaxID=47427 RepID=A0A2H3E939_ARMGA|nr:hypothetical protein ARMGADRAFT_1028366 [Armillaria gallica]
MSSLLERQFTLSSLARPPLLKLTVLRNPSTNEETPARIAFYSVIALGGLESLVLENPVLHETTSGHTGLACLQYRPWAQHTCTIMIKVFGVLAIGIRVLFLALKLGYGAEWTSIPLIDDLASVALLEKCKRGASKPKLSSPEEGASTYQAGPLPQDHGAYYRSKTANSWVLQPWSTSRTESTTMYMKGWKYFVKHIFVECYEDMTPLKDYVKLIDTDTFRLDDWFILESALNVLDRAGIYRASRLLGMRIWSSPA